MRPPSARSCLGCAPCPHPGGLPARWALPKGIVELARVLEFRTEFRTEGDSDLRHPSRRTAPPARLLPLT